MKRLIPILLAVFAFAACEKDPDMDKLDNDYLVYTNYDKKANFKEFTTYYLPDKILVISDKEEPNIWKVKLHKKFLLLIRAIWITEATRWLLLKKMLTWVYR